MTANNKLPPDRGSFEAELRRLQNDALALAERDRQLLGYEIHDGLVQDLTAAAMLLDGRRPQRQRLRQWKAKRTTRAACGCCTIASPKPAV